MKINVPYWIIILGDFSQIFKGLISDNLVGKVATQIAYYLMQDIPEKSIFKTGNYITNTLFVFFTIVYSILVITNINNH